MISLKLLGHVASVLFALWVGQVKTSPGEVKEPATDLARELQCRVKSIMKQPRINGRLVTSQELAESFETLLDWTVGSMHGLAASHDTYRSILEPLVAVQFYSITEFSIENWVKRYESPEFFHCRIRGCISVLGFLTEILEQWGGAEEALLCAVAKFIRSDIEVLRVNCKIENCAITPYELSWDFSSSDDNEDGLKLPRQVEDCICAEYEKLTTELAKKFDQMANDFESSLAGLKGSQLIQVYQSLVRYLNQRHSYSVSYPLEADRQTANFEVDNRKRLIDAHSLLRVSINWKCAKSSLKILEMDPGCASGPLPPRDYRRFDRDVDQGPPLFLAKHAQELIGADEACLGPGQDLKYPPAGLRYSVICLGKWVYALYLELLQNENPSVSLLYEQARGWINSVEHELWQVLKIVESKDKRERRFLIGIFIFWFKEITFDVEAILRILYRQEELKREEGGPGYFWFKLEHMAKAACHL